MADYCNNHNYYIMFLSHYLGVYISEVSYWRPLTFQVGGDAMGNAPTFLLAIDMNLSQFQDFVCQNAFASGAYSAPQTPSWKPLGHAKMNPPPHFENLATGLCYGLVWTSLRGAAVLRDHHRALGELTNYNTTILF